MDNNSISRNSRLFLLMNVTMRKKYFTVWWDIFCWDVTDWWFTKKLLWWVQRKCVFTKFICGLKEALLVPAVSTESWNGLNFSCTAICCMNLHFKQQFVDINRNLKNCNWLKFCRATLPAEWHNMYIENKITESLRLTLLYMLILILLILTYIHHITGRTSSGSNRTWQRWLCPVCWSVQMGSRT